jgi:hypothetical protein
MYSKIKIRCKLVNNGQNVRQTDNVLFYEISHRV